MAFQCVTNYSNFVIISWTEYSFLSQQSAMSVHNRAGFLSPNQISELVWGSESEADALSNCIIYLGNRILCIFRQPLKYHCFSYSSFDERNMYRLAIPSSKRYKENDGASLQNGTALNKGWSVSVSEATQLKYHVEMRVV